MSIDAEGVNDDATDLSSTSSTGTAEEVYLEAARHFLDVQISTLDVLDTKTSQAFSVGSVVLPVTFALLNLSNAEVPNGRLARLWDSMCSF